MIPQEFLEILRCPMDPDSLLTQEGDTLCCGRCGTRFPVREGIPALIATEAILPPGVTSLARLPCQRERGRGKK